MDALECSGSPKRRGTSCRRASLNSSERILFRRHTNTHTHNTHQNQKHTACNDSLDFHSRLARAFYVAAPWIEKAKTSSADILDPCTIDFLELVSKTPVENLKSNGLSEAGCEHVNAIRCFMTSYALSCLKETVSSYSDFVLKLCKSSFGPLFIVFIRCFISLSCFFSPHPFLFCKHVMSYLARFL